MIVACMPAMSHTCDKVIAWMEARTSKPAKPLDTAKAPMKTSTSVMVTVKCFSDLGSSFSKDSTLGTEYDCGDDKAGEV